AAFEAPQNVLPALQPWSRDREPLPRPASLAGPGGYQRCDLTARYRSARINRAAIRFLGADDSGNRLPLLEPRSLPAHAPCGDAPAIMDTFRTLCLAPPPQTRVRCVRQARCL